jgi:hypothetical protein
MAYIDGASSGNAIAALYAVNSGSAGALLAQSKAVSIGTTFSWVDFQLPSAYTVTAGTTYGLAIMGNVPLNIMEGGSGQRDHNAVSSYGNGFKNPFGAVWGTDNVGAMSIYASGTSTPTPTPTPTPVYSGTYSGTNIVPVPHDSTGNPYWGIWDCNPVPFNANNNLDFTVLGHDGVYPSVNIGGIANGEVYHGYVAKNYNGADECDATWINVQPGDHIYYSAWLKSGSSGGQDPDLIQMFHRAIALGFDWEGAGTWIGGNFADGHDYIPYGIGWNTNTWTYVQYDFIVPATVPAANSINGHNIGDPIVPVAIYPWIGGDLYDSGQIWFSDVVLYINPSG